VLEMSGADYQVRGLGYIHSQSDIEQIAVGSNNGTPILIRDLGIVSLGPTFARASRTGMAKARRSAASS